MPRIAFSVALAKGKQRPRVLRSGHAYTPRETTRAELVVAEAYRTASIEAYGQVLRAEAHVPVRISVQTERPLPKGRPKSVLSEPDTYKPDWDNVGKLVSDALNGVAYADDAQVTRAVVEKAPRRPGQAERTLVTVAWDGDRSQPDKEETPCQQPMRTPTSTTSSSPKLSSRRSPRLSARRAKIAFALALTLSTWSSTRARAARATT